MTTDPMDKYHVIYYLSAFSITLSGAARCSSRRFSLQLLRADRVVLILVLLAFRSISFKLCQRIISQQLHLPVLQERRRVKCAWNAQKLVAHLKFQVFGKKSLRPRPFQFRKNGKMQDYDSPTAVTCSAGHWPGVLSAPHQAKTEETTKNIHSVMTAFEGTNDYIF